MALQDENKPLGRNRPLQWEEDGYTVTRSASHSGPGCHNGCDVLLYTDKNGKLVKVEGDPQAPFNQGRLCSRCLALPEVVNHPDRLQYPMKRVGERGENKWQRITWDEAYDGIIAGLNTIKEKYGPESVIFAQGTGRDITPYISRLAWTYGSPNPTYLLSGSACYLPRIAACYNTTGSFWVADCSQTWPDRYDNSQYKAPETMVLWGNNPIVANADGFFGHWVVDLMRRGTQLIVVDPRMTFLASKAALWLPIRPGTDAALALGMLNIIIQEELYDKEFVDKWTYGFDKLAERVAQYPVEKVAEITWLPKEKIIAAARMFAQSKHATVQWGLALDMTKEAIPATMAIIDLVAICGNLDVPGGWIPPYFVVNMGFGWGNELISKEMHAKRLGVAEYPLTGRGFNLSQPDVTVKAMVTGKPYPVKGAWLQTTNVLACTTSDPKYMLKGLLNCDLVVVVDLFMTPTAVAAADYVLPAATYPERDGIRSCDNPQYGATINKVTQIGEVKSDMQINLELGKRLNPEAWPWDNVQDMFTSLIQNSHVAGYDFKQLRQDTPVYKAYSYKKYEAGGLRFDGQPGFNTPTGRVELYSLSFEECGLDPLPYFEEPTYSPNSAPEYVKEYPIVLTTGARDWASFHSEHRQVGRLRALKPRPIFEIHPDTAAKYGIREGDMVWIENHLGRAKRKAKLTTIIDPRVINTDHGWWFPEEEGAQPHLFGVWETNINQLMEFVPGRSGFGSNFKGLMCKIYKVKEGE
jgi:anaerobic selenocysteine-containing dehydrogenase